MKIKRIPPPVVTGFINVFTCTILMLLFTLPTYSQSGEKWASNGNAVTPGSFLGTTNDFPLYVKVNNALALTIEPGGKVKLNLFTGGEGIVSYDTYGTLSQIPFSGDNQTVLLGNGQWGPVPIPQNFWKMDQANHHLYTLTSGNVGIGTSSPVMKLDVNGDAVIRGYLYVDNGVIIGKKIESKTVDSDTLKVNEVLTSKEMFSDSLTTLKVQTEKIEASQEAKIGSQLYLDGLNSQIYSQSGNIDFRNTNLRTDGTLTANNLNVQNFNIQNANFTQLQVAEILKVGLQSIKIASYLNLNGQVENEIYVGSGDLKLQSGAHSANTFMHTGNGGKLGIGVPFDYFTLNPNASKVTVAGNLLIQGDDGFDASEEEAILYLGDNNHYIKSIYGGGLRIGTFQAPDAVMLMQANGFVGIGTDNPQKSLHVKDIKNLTIPPDQVVDLGPIPGDPYDDNNFDPSQEATGSLRLELLAGPGNQAIWDIEPVTTLTQTVPPVNKLYIGPKDKTVPVMTFNYDGKVGIGTTHPYERLQIGDRWTFHNGGTKVIGYNFKYEDGEARRILDGPVSQICFGANGDIDFRFSPDGNANGNITHNYKTGLKLTNDGKVGIGTESPATRLTIKGLENDENIVLIKPYNWIDGSNARICLGDNGHFLQATHSFGMTFVDNNKKFVFRGINEADDVNLTVNGKIECKEVEVKLDLATVPDYVFEKNYCLLPLNEVKKYIEANKHLPGVPSAAEIHAGGMNVGEFNALLLKKIEELTLYILQQEDAMEKLQRDLDSFKRD